MLWAVLKNAASATAAALTPKDGTFYKYPGLWSFCLPITDLGVHKHYLIILGRYVPISYLPLLVQVLSSKRSFPRPQRCQLENIGGFVNVKTHSLNSYECRRVLLQIGKGSLYFLVHLTPSAMSVWIFPICTSRYVCLRWTEFSPKFMPVF